MAASFDVDIQWREPEQMAIGDSLIFQRSLPDYPAGLGWSLTYTVTQLTPQGGQKVFTFVSQPQGDLHLLNVANFGAGLDAGDYILAGFAVNAGPPAERHQVYYGELTLGPDLGAGAIDKPIYTTAQQMIWLLKAQLKTIYAHALQRTEVQRNGFEWAKRAEIRTELCFWEERRAFELKVLARANGQGNENQMMPSFFCG